MSKKIQKHGEYQKDWWHKDWDNTFKIHLYETAVITPKTYRTFNDMAKEQIARIIEIELKEQIRRYNLYALAVNESMDQPHRSAHEIDKLIRHFQYKRERSGEIENELKKLKDLL